MDKKVEVVECVMRAMRKHLGAQTMEILKGVLVMALRDVEIKQAETQLATSAEINARILELFRMKKAGKLSNGTVCQYLRHITLLLETIHKPLTSMTELDIEYFLLEYKKRGNTNCTVNNCKRYLSAFFTWMRKTRLMSENPVENIDNFKQTVKPIEHLEPEQWEQLKGGCKTVRDRALLEFLRCTAVRDGEVPGVCVSDVDWTEGKITIYGQKSNKYRVVCIDRIAKDYLLKYLNERQIKGDSREPLFVSKRSSTLTRGGIYASVKKIAERARMQINVYPHLMRKTTATNIIKRGGSTEEVSEYLGHAEKNTAGRYYIYKGEEHILEIFRRRIAAV